ncbi:MAG: pyridoxal-phosphate dependent enzyme [Spirochaetota bacterium]|jgi:threonine synthase|nr:pyridoxal-phosphate dependent enzyme [Spirochaetota bacterium]
MITYICKQCGKTYPVSTKRYACECGSLFHLSYPKTAPAFGSLGGDRSLWRYRSALPPFDEKTIKRVTMGEGGTPVIRLEEHLYGKADYLMPTLSFKDRGAVMLAALMVEIGVKRCAIDSSGNAATAVAAYAARAGIATEVFVPASTSAKKLTQIEAHGGRIHAIEGSRDETARATIDYVNKSEIFYASHIFNPFFWEGTKTYVYELYERFGSLPEVLIVPVGNGTLLMGVYLALQELKAWNLIDSHPLVIALQAAGCAPLAQAYDQGSLSPQSVLVSPTLAEGIATGEPARGKEILQAVHDLGGRFVTVTEEEILKAHGDLAKKGVYVEYTGAANYAAYRVALKEDPMLADKTSLIPLTGAGLKSAQ